MTIRLPQRPTEPGYHQRLWDAIRALIPVQGNGTLLRHTSRGTIIAVNRAGGKSTPAPAGGFMRWRGAWSSTESYEINDVVRFPLESGESNGQSMGTFICIQAAPAGSPQPKNITVHPQDQTSAPYWQIISAESWNAVVVSGVIGSIGMYGSLTSAPTLDLNNGVITMRDSSVGRDRTLRIDISTLDAFELPDSLDVRLREILFEAGGSTYKVIALCTAQEYVGPA